MDSRKQQGYDNGVIYMDNKKKFAAICIGVLILAASVGTTLAYLGATDNKDNKIKVGTDVAQVSETFSEPEVQKQQNTTPKEIKVENTGSVPCFVRVYAEFSDSYIASIAKVTYGDSDTEKAWEGTSSFKEYLAGTDNTTNWVFIPEDATGYDGKLQGYFYYKEAVPVGGLTDALIKSVKVTYPDTNTEDYIRDYEMIVYTETVQTVDTDTGTDYADGNQWETAWKRFLKIPTP